MTIQRRILAGHLAFICLLLGSAIAALNILGTASKGRIEALKLDPGLKEAQLLRQQFDALQRWAKIRDAFPADELQDPVVREQEAARFNEEVMVARATYRALRLRLDRVRAEGLDIGEMPESPALMSVLALEAESPGDDVKGSSGQAPPPNGQAADGSSGPAPPPNGKAADGSSGPAPPPDGKAADGSSGPPAAPSEREQGAWPSADLISGAKREISAVYEHVLRAENKRTADIGEKFDNAARILMAIILVALVMAAVSSYLAIRWTIEPINRLLVATSEIAKGKLDISLPVMGNDEFAMLSIAFNRMSDELARARKRESDFLAVATHELKTPLACIKAYAGTVRRALPREGPGPEAADYLGRIEDEVINLTGKVSKLLDLGVIEAGQLRLRKREFMTQGFLLMATAAFKPIAAQRGIEYDVAVDPSVPPMMTADPDRLRQVLANVLDNAFKYTPAGGNVRFSARRVDGLLEIEVADTGPGIPPDQLRTIFEKYARVRSDPGAERAGTGLGLAVARGIVAAHEGTIEARSAPGKGSLFLIRLPVAVAKAGTSMDVGSPAAEKRS